MSLRTRLVISFTVLLLVVIAAVGLVASRSVESILVGQIDSDLIGFFERGPGPSENQGEGPGPSEENNEFYRRFAEMLVDANGETIHSRPSGFADNPDPLPDVSELADSYGVPLDLQAVDGSLEYRGIIEDVRDGTDFVVAAPMGGVATATDSLVNSLLLAGLGVLLVGGAATWWTVERSMRPVGQMVETAEAIAAGDLSRRVPDLGPYTELGRLGSSLNEMLVTIEDAVDTEREGRDRLRQFVGDASHELRTPVTAITGYAELRRRGGLTTSEAENRAWDRIESEGRRMGSLIEDLLMLTRLGQSHPLRLGEVDVMAVVRNAAADHRVIDLDRPVSVNGPESALIVADEERLHQVVTSMLDNVRVHTLPGTVVEIAVTDNTEGVVLELTDNGPGIPASAVGRVFDRFYRADPSRSRRSGGNGLGLSIVEAIVMAHGGQVEASNADSGGARITISLPRYAQGAAPEHSATSQAAPKIV